jgi:hypothetical protein
LDQGQSAKVTEKKGHEQMINVQNDEACNKG